MPVGRPVAPASHFFFLFLLQARQLDAVDQHSLLSFPRKREPSKRCRDTVETGGGYWFPAFAGMTGGVSRIAGIMRL